MPFADEAADLLFDMYLSVKTLAWAANLSVLS
jgi:hypothetical protein